MKEKGPDHEKGEDYEDIEHQMNPASLQPREPAVAKSKDVPRTPSEKVFEEGTA